jgi:hypothetical protein
MSETLKYLLELWKQETNPDAKKQLFNLVNSQMENDQKAKMLETEQKVLTHLPEHQHITVEGGVLTLDKLDKTNKLRLTIKGNSKVTIGKETVQPVPAATTPVVNKPATRITSKIVVDEDEDTDL